MPIKICHSDSRSHQYLRVIIFSRYADDKLKEFMKLECMHHLFLWFTLGFINIKKKIIIIKIITLYVPNDIIQTFLSRIMQYLK